MHCGHMHVCKLTCAIPYTRVYSIEYMLCVQQGMQEEANAYTHVYSYTHVRVFVMFHLSGTIYIPSERMVLDLEIM